MAAKLQFEIGDKGLSWLRPLFRELPHQITDYIKWHDLDKDRSDKHGEVPYFNNEAATASLLVRAAARSGYFSLADYSTYKLRQRKRYLGRCDLYLACDDGYLEIETKQVFVGPGAKRAIEDAFKRAEDNAKCIIDPNRAAMVFATMNISFDKKPHNWKGAFDDLFSNVNCGLRWTWCDPAPGSIHRWNSRCYPGFAIFIRRVP